MTALPLYMSASTSKWIPARARGRIHRVLAMAPNALDRSTTRPELLPDDAVTIIALVPAVIAGLLLFRQPAAEILGLALAAGVVCAVAGRLARWPRSLGPVLAALIGAAALGPGARLVWVGACAVAAAGGELLRSRFLPKARVQVGLVVYALALLIGRSAVNTYLAPLSGSRAAEPVRAWLDSAATASVDPTALYVGYVPGPVFATSLLAIVIGLTWFWYARRLSPIVLVGVLLGATLPILVFRWDPVLQLDSGPLWLFAGLVLADRRLLPESRKVRPLLGIALGLLAVALRERNLAIGASIGAVAALQLLVAATEGA